MRVHCIQHDDLVKACTIVDWAKRARARLTFTRIYKGEPLPKLSEIDVLIVLGGRMGAYEEDHYPWLITEKMYIKQAIAKKKFVFGICLGAQMIAHVLGGIAHPHVHKEIGWWPVTFLKAARKSPLAGLPKQLTLFEFHGDTFTLPEGAVLLASSAGCRNQAFSYREHVLAVQFHPEMTQSQLVSLSAAVADEAGPFSQIRETYLQQEAHFATSKIVMYHLLNEIQKKHYARGVGA